MENVAPHKPVNSVAPGGCDVLENAAQRVFVPINDSEKIFTAYESYIDKNILSDIWIQFVDRFIKYVIET